jgi:hypothetical protein
MILRTRMKDPDVLTRVGGAALLLASLATWFIHPSSDFADGFKDGIAGVLYGVSIATMLLAVRIRSKGNKAS